MMRPQILVTHLNIETCMGGRRCNDQNNDFARPKCCQGGTKDSVDFTVQDIWTIPKKISQVLVLKWLDCSKMAGNSQSELEFSTMLPKKRKQTDFRHRQSSQRHQDEFWETSKVLEKSPQWFKFFNFCVFLIVSNWGKIPKLPKNAQNELESSTFCYQKKVKKTQKNVFRDRQSVRRHQNVFLEISKGVWIMPPPQ